MIQHSVCAAVFLYTCAMDDTVPSISVTEAADTLYTVGFYLKLVTAILVHVHAFVLMFDFLLWRSGSVSETRFILKAIILWLIGFVLCKIAERIERLQLLQHRDGAEVQP